MTTLAFILTELFALDGKGWSGGAMVLGKLPVPGRPTIWMTVGQGPVVLAGGAGGDCLDMFTLVCPFLPFSPSLRETARYRLKYCLKGSSNPKQPTNPLMVSDAISSPLQNLQTVWNIILILHSYVEQVISMFRVQE